LKKKYLYSDALGAQLTKVGGVLVQDEYFLLSFASLNNFNYQDLCSNWLLEDVYRLSAISTVKQLQSIEA